MQTELTFAQRMSQVVRSTKAAQRHVNTDFHPDDTIRTEADIHRWLEYWGRSVASLREIHSVEDMRECRLFVPQMSGGLFADISDEQMWDALVSLRSHQFHEAECEAAAMAYLREKKRNARIAKASCRVARNEDAAPQRDRLVEHTPNTYPHDLPVLNSKGN